MTKRKSPEVSNIALETELQNLIPDAISDYIEISWWDEEATKKIKPTAYIQARQKGLYQLSLTEIKIKFSPLPQDIESQVENIKELFTGFIDSLVKKGYLIRAVEINNIFSEKIINRILGYNSPLEELVFSYDREVVKQVTSYSQNKFLNLQKLKIYLFEDFIEDDESYTPNVDRVTFVELIRQFPKLKSLGISYEDEEQNFDLPDMQIFPLLPDLEELDLEDVNYPNAQFITSIADNCKKLKTIKLWKLEEDTIQPLKRLFKECNQLQTVEIKYSMIFEENGCSSILDAPLKVMLDECANITNLNILGSQIDANEFLSYATGKCPKLKSLNLRDTKIIVIDPLNHDHAVLQEDVIHTISRCNKSILANFIATHTDLECLILPNGLIFDNRVKIEKLLDDLTQPQPLFSTPQARRIVTPRPINLSFD